MNSSLHKILAFCLVFGISTQSTAKDTDTPILYINQDGLPLTELLSEISSQTGYDIKLVGEWPNIPVTTTLKGISLEAGLKKIIKELGNVSHILVFDNHQKTIKIASINPGQDPDVELLRVFSGEGEETQVSPPSPSGEPGLTTEQLAELKAAHSRELLNRTQDFEISPPSEFGPGLSIAQFEAIKKSYNLDIKEDDGTSPVSPPSEHGEGLTKSEVEYLKASNKKRIAAAGPAIEVSPPSAKGPGLTQGELESIKAAYAARPITDEMIVSPPSEHGPGLTLGELQMIKNKHSTNSKPMN